MKILITGGTGFIGKELCKRLLQRGAQLTVLSRRPETVAERCGDQVAGLGSLAALTADDHFDAVINLAGEPIADARWTERRKRLLWESRVTLTEQLVDYFSRAQAKPKVLISGSAVGYYGDGGDRVLDEASAYTDDFSHRLCAAWEQAALKAGDYGVRVCILRTGLVIGKNGGFLQRLLPPFKLGLGGRLGDGRQWMSSVHRNDLIRMIEHLLDSPGSSGAYNGTAPHPVTNREFTQTLAKVLKRPALLPVPALVLKAALGELSVLLLGGQRVIPKRFLDEQFEFEFDTLEQALTDVLAV
jgi:uncharacterized protein